MHPGVEIHFDPDLLVPLIERTIERVLARQRALRSFDRPLGEQLLFTEQQAAARLGMTPIALKEERLNGRIEYLKRGRQVKYLPEHLVSYVRTWNDPGRENDSDPAIFRGNDTPTGTKRT